MKIRSLTRKFSRCLVSNKNREGARMRYALIKILSRSFINNKYYMNRHYIVKRGFLFNKLEICR